MSTPDPLQSAFRSAVGAVLTFLNVSKYTAPATPSSQAADQLAELLNELQDIERQLAPYAKSAPERHKPLEERRAVLRHQAGRVGIELKKAPSGKDLQAIEGVIGRLGEEIDKLRMAVEALQTGEPQQDEGGYDSYLQTDSERENPDAYSTVLRDSVDSNPQDSHENSPPAQVPEPESTPSGNPLRDDSDPDLYFAYSVESENPEAYSTELRDSVDSSPQDSHESSPPAQGLEPEPSPSGNALRDDSNPDLYFAYSAEQEALGTSNPDTYDQLGSVPDAPPQPGEDGSQALTARQVEAKRKQLNRALAHLATFLPERLWREWSASLSESIKPFDPDNGEQVRSAYEALLDFENLLAGSSLEFSQHEAIALRERIGKNLLVLPDTSQQSLQQRFSGLGDEGGDLQELRELDGDVRRAIKDWKQAVAGLIVDFEALGPLVQQAIKLAEATRKKGLKDDLEGAWTQLKDQFDGTEGHGDIDTLRGGIDVLRALAKETMELGSPQDLLDIQSANLPVDPAGLGRGVEVGKGNFGAVSKLTGSDDTPLVGKAFNPGNPDAKKEMEHEARIYAKLGEHPNIAKCYGIQNIQGQSMLVMEEIQGKDMNKVFSELETGYRNKQVNRQEYLGTVQQMVKGILQGLAHFESVGLVHRDIKGDNIRFDEKTGKPKLIDMGLSQEQGPKQDPKNFFPTSPPEAFVSQVGDPLVQSVWDSFSTGKILFPLLEQDPESAKQFQFVTGVGAMEAELTEHSQGSIQPTINQAFVQTVTKGAQDSVQRSGPGVVTAKTDGKGNPVGQTLKPKGSSEKVKPGEFGAMTAYVDFMNRLTHPDPAQRLSPQEALKHPFMTEALLEEDDVSKILDSVAPKAPVSVDLDEDDFDLDDDDQDEQPPNFETWKNLGINPDPEVAGKLGIAPETLQEMATRHDVLYPDILAAELKISQEELFKLLTAPGAGNQSGSLSDDEDQEEAPPDFDIWKNLGINPSAVVAAKLGLSLEALQEMATRHDVLYPDILAAELKISQEELFKRITAPGSSPATHELEPEPPEIPDFDYWSSNSIHPDEFIASKLGMSVTSLTALLKKIGEPFAPELAEELGISVRELYERIYGQS